MFTLALKEVFEPKGGRGVMSRSNCVRLAALLLLLLCPVYASGMDQAQQKACRQRLRTEALPAWASLESSMEYVSGKETYTFTSDNPQRGAQTYDRKVVQFWLTGSAAKVVTDAYDKSGKWLDGRVYCFNPDYAYSQTQARQKGDLVVSNYSNNADIVNRVKEPIFRYIAAARIAGYGFAHPPLTQLVNDDACEIVSCKTVEQGGRSLLEVTLRYPPSGRAAVFDPSTRLTTVRLDPGARWRVVSDKTVSAHETDIIDVDYVEGSSDPARVSNIRAQKIYPPPTSVKVEETWEFSDLSYQPIPVAEFQLQRVPLQNATWSGRLSTAVSRLWWWIVLVLVIAIFAYVLYRQRERTQLPPT